MDLKSNTWLNSKIANAGATRDQQQQQPAQPQQLPPQPQQPPPQLQQPPPQPQLLPPQPQQPPPQPKQPPPPSKQPPPLPQQTGQQPQQPPPQPQQPQQQPEPPQQESQPQQPQTFQPAQQPPPQIPQQQEPLPSPQQHTGVVNALEDALGQVNQYNQNFVAQDDVSQNQQCGLLKIPTSVGKCLMFMETEHTNRFTQSEHQSACYNSNCLEPTINTDNYKAEPAIILDLSTAQQEGTRTQMYSGGNYESKEPDIHVSNPSEFPFCYNVNMPQKVHQLQGPVSVGHIEGDDKGCYRFDGAQPFSYNYALLNQMSQAATAPAATFKCDACGLVSDHLSLLNHHKRLHNIDTGSNAGTLGANAAKKQYSCDICRASFNLVGELKSHKDGMHDKNSKNQLHHTQIKCCLSRGVDIVCEHQIGNINSSEMIKKHDQFVEGGSCQEINAVGGNKINMAPSAAYSGGTATEEPSNTSVTVIKPAHHPVKRRGNASVTICNVCNGSGIIFIGGTHKNTEVEKSFHCNVCYGTFSGYSSLWSHKRLHSGDKPFKCETCGVAFARATYLKNHWRVHTGEKPFKCAVCEMQFSRSHHLKNHERIHSGERPYQCEVCDKTFARYSTLWNHRRIHTGEKPYRCDVCGSAFIQATHLKSHARVHTGEKPHCCDICNKGFSDRFALKRHHSIHEKCGRTSAANSSTVNTPVSQGNNENKAYSDNPVNSVNSVNYVNNDNAGTNINPVIQNRNPQEGLDELYKCEVGGSIAFPGFSQPHEEKQ